MSAPIFSDEERARYSRQLMLPQIGAAGQQRLKNARVLCIGAGGLGSPAALYLAAAGVGTLGLIDSDSVDLSNLHRQILHGTSDVGRAKLESARDRIAEMNPHVRVVLHRERFVADNALAIVRDYDVVVDGSDNFPTRYASNDACVLSQKPNVYGSVFQFDGQASVFAPHLGGPCYRCIFPEPPPPGAAPSCAEAGVLGVLPGIVGLIQATETIKLVTGLGDTLLGRLLHFDALKMTFREFKLRRDPQCPICGDAPTISAPQQVGATCAAPASLTVRQLKAKLEAGEALQLIDVREPAEHEIAHIDSARLIPVAQLETRHAEITSDTPVVLFCHSGVRSAYAAELLRASGFDNVLNLEGGIDAWSREIDPSVPRY
jgi:molybdopterin/thiamine biosynthesis adenylyltransferase/rhodanese-related sulfurtransferase